MSPDVTIDGVPGDDTLHFDCPRCAAVVDEAYYGPCASCRTSLRERFDGLAHEVVAEGYEPKMNVTPNAVALKD